MRRDELDKLIAQVERGPATPRERLMAHALKQIASQHDFAFSSWKQAVKRSGHLSSELGPTRTAQVDRTIVELGVHDAKTVVVPHAEETKTRVFKHSGGAFVIRPGKRVA